MRNISNLFLASIVFWSFLAFSTHLDEEHGAFSEDESVSSLSPQDDNYDLEVVVSSSESDEGIETFRFKSRRGNFKRASAFTLPKKLANSSENCVEFKPNEVDILKAKLRKRPVKKGHADRAARIFLRSNPKFFEELILEYFKNDEVILLKSSEGDRNIFISSKLEEISAQNGNFSIYLRETAPMREVWAYFREITRKKIAVGLEGIHADQLLFLMNGIYADQNPMLVEGYIAFLASNLMRIINETPLEVREFFSHLRDIAEIENYPSKSEDYNHLKFGLTQFFLYIFNPLILEVALDNLWFYEDELLKYLVYHLENGADKSFEGTKAGVLEAMKGNSALLSKDEARMGSALGSLSARRMNLVNLLQYSFNVPGKKSEKLGPGFSAVYYGLVTVFYNQVAPRRTIPAGRY